jgi:hypothetical protein
MTTSTELAALRDEAIKLTCGMSNREYNLVHWIRYLERARLWEQTAAADPLSAQWLAEDLADARKYRDRYLTAAGREKAA